MSQDKEYITKTLSVKLDIPEDNLSDVQETFRQFNFACREVLDVAWNGDKKITSKQILHHETYYDIREKTDLVANLVCNARNRVAEAVKACVARWSKGKKASKPTFHDTGSVVYDKRTATIKDRYCTLATVNGRIRAEYVVGDYQRDLLDNDDYERRSATLKVKDGTYYLNITIRKEVTYQPTSKVMGVDLGVNNIAVTSTGKFFDAGFYNWKRNGYFRTKRSLQAKGTRGARRVLKRLKQRENRFSEDYIHNVAKEMVQEALDHGVDTIVFEKLDDIRDSMKNSNKRTKRQMHVWAFRKLQEYVCYKASEAGIKVRFQDARYTSQKCSKCDHRSKSNRNGANFKCSSCDYQVHADYNAAKNVGMNYVHKICTQKQKSSEVEPTCHLALKSGVLSLNGTYVPTEEEPTDKLRPLWRRR